MYETFVQICGVGQNSNLCKNSSTMLHLLLYFKNAKRVSNSRKIVQLDFCFLKKKIKIKTTNLNIDEHYKNLCKMIQNLSQMRFQMLKFFKPKMCIEHEKSFFVLTLLYETHESLVLQSWIVLALEIFPRFFVRFQFSEF